METKIDEIADGIYRLSTFVPEIAPPASYRPPPDVPSHPHGAQSRHLRPNGYAGLPSAIMRLTSAAR